MPNSEDQIKKYSAWNETEQVIYNRRSIRAYKDKPVLENLTRQILEAGRFAPSAGNYQPWRFIVLNGKEIVQETEDRIISYMRPFKGLLDLTGKMHELFVSALRLPTSNSVTDIRPLGAMREILHGRLKVFHNAPLVIVILKDVRGIGNPDLDCGFCAQNIVLAAHALGLGTCYIGLIEILAKDPFWKKKMGISHPWEVVTSITVGYPKYKPDGVVQRDRPQIDWYNDGDDKAKVMY